MYLYIKIVSTLKGFCLIQNPYQHINKTINITNTTLIHSFEIVMYHDAAMYMSQDGIHRKALYVKCDIPVAVYGFTFTGYAVDGYLALPIQNLGKKYIVSTLAVESRSGNGTSRFGIVGVAATTNVTVKLKMANGSINYQNSQYRNGDRMNFQLARFDTFFLSHNYDLSGTTIMSSHTITVMSGNSLTYRSIEGRSMEEMLLPCDQFEKIFIIPNLFGQKCQTRVFAQLQTHVLVQNQHLLQQYILSEGEFVEFEHFESITVNASNAVLVELYCNENTTYHGASMITVPGLLHYKSHYKFPVPYFQHKSQPRFYITILIRSDEKHGLKLDHQFNIQYLKEVHISVSGYLYSILSVEMPVRYRDNLHEAVHINGIPFGLIVYGHNDEQSYGYPAGLSLRH